MKCLVKDCTNQSHEGHFINNLCYPCYQYITEGSGNSVLHRDAEEAAMFHYKRGFQDAKEIHMQRNSGRIEKLEWNLGDVENALNNMKQYNKHLRNTIAETQEKLDIERNRTEELEEQLTSAKLVNSGLHTRLKNLQDKLDEVEPVEECLFDTQEEHDRYELEQAIMSCWGITDDLQLIAKQYAGGDESLITSVSNLYDLKFRNLFEQFEKFTGVLLMDDLEFLEWIYERMTKVHGENQNTDYMKRFRRLLAAMQCRQEEANNETCTSKRVG